MRSMPLRSRSLRSRLAAGAFAASLMLVMGAAEDKPRPPLVGLNISGGEFGKSTGRVEFDYTFPDADDVAYVAAKGLTTIRVPFLWERIQPVLDGPLDPGELGRLRAVVGLAQARGLRTILDVHNYARYRDQVIGSPGVPIDAFAGLWTNLAHAFRNEPSVIFGLMNEPHDMPTEIWAEAAQKALDAIRQTGASQLVLVPGNDWSGAHSWTNGSSGTSNARALRRIDDPIHNMAFEMHQYLDADYSGTSPVCQAPDRVAATLTAATQWLRDTGSRGLLGEFGASADPQCLAGLAALLNVLDDNSDVWIGWTYWAAGRWWPATYPLSIQPQNGQDRPQMAVLLASRRPTTAK